MTGTRFGGLLSDLPLINIIFRLIILVSTVMSVSSLYHLAMKSLLINIDAIGSEFHILPKKLLHDMVYHSLQYPQCVVTIKSLIERWPLETFSSFGLYMSRNVISMIVSLIKKHRIGLKMNVPT